MPRIYNQKVVRDSNECTRNGWKYDTDVVPCKFDSCEYPGDITIKDENNTIVPLGQQEGVEMFKCTDETVFNLEDPNNLEFSTTLKGTVCDFRCKAGYKTMMPNGVSEIICYLANKPHWLWTTVQ